MLEPVARNDVMGLEGKPFAQSLETRIDNFKVHVQRFRPTPPVRNGNGCGWLVARG
ncbi:MAG: hypothetical protein WD873_07855 [Candidatus Hydrogenedentales bacterium]